MSDLVLTVSTETAGADATGSADEHALIQRARAGEMNAFEEIMLRYENRILRFLTGTVGDVEVAQEICQETFLAAYRAFPRTNSDLKLSSWLHTIALNRARSHHRRRRLRTFLPLVDDHVSSAPDLQHSVAMHDTVQRAPVLLVFQMRQYCLS